MNPARALRAANHQLDTMVAATPEHRERYIDLLRVLAIGVVVIWHWSLSIFYWSDDRWAMPNPIHDVTGGWLATWLLQIVPVFFIVGGYANSASWWSARQQPGGLGRFYRGRLARLLLPPAVFVAVWLVIELAAYALVSDYPGVIHYGRIAFNPLWFLGAYLWVVLLTPLTATLHARHRWLTLAVLAGLMIGADLGRFAGGISAFGWVNTALVWVLIHQFGYFLRDGTLRRLRPAATVGLAALAVLALALLTSLEAYPRSMVATVGQPRSNILPTTVPIAVVALLQLSLIRLAWQPAARWLARPRVWKPVVAANAVILTVLVWHMTAMLVVLGVLRALAVPLVSQPTAGWWWQRPLWLLAPAVVLAGLVAIFGSFEWANQRWLRTASRLLRRR